MKVLKENLNFDWCCESEDDYKRLYIMHSMAYSCVIGAKWGDYHCANSGDYHCANWGDYQCANWGDLSFCQMGRFCLQVPNGAIIILCQLGRYPDHGLDFISCIICTKFISLTIYLYLAFDFYVVSVLLFSSSMFLCLYECIFVVQEY